jgi:hypothetical protein
MKIISLFFYLIFIQARSITDVAYHVSTVAPKGANSQSSEGATSFELHIVAPLLRIACFTLMDSWSGLEKLQFWCMLSDSFSHILRPGKLTNHCRQVYDIELPTNPAHWDVDGYPKFFTIIFRSFKTQMSGR